MNCARVRGALSVNSEASLRRTKDSFDMAAIYPTQYNYAWLISLLKFTALFANVRVGK
jgi:hypothetical protein